MVRFHSSLSLFAAFAAVTALSGCGASKEGAADGPDPTPTPESTIGELDVDWTFSGVEAPSKVRIFVIDGDTSAYTCETLPFSPSLGIVENKANLPVNGSAIFDDVAEGNKYLVIAIGEKSNGTRVAFDCHDQVNVVGAETTNVVLELENIAADMNGVYDVAHNVNLELPDGVVSALLLIQAACGFLNAPELCDIAAEVHDIVTSLDVTAKWTLDQNSTGQFDGEVVWLTIQGQDIGTWEILDGQFIGEVPGATTLNYKEFHLQLHVGNLTLFILEEVLDLDLGSYGYYGALLVNALADNYVSPLSFDGTGTIQDVAPADGVADRITGDLSGHLQVGSFNHDFSMDYLATRP